MTVTIQVEGMMCAHCEARVNKAVTALLGVTSCVASANDHQAVVTFDEASIQETQIKTAIEDTGYEVK